MNRTAIASELVAMAKLLTAYGEDPEKYAEGRARAISELEAAKGSFSDTSVLGYDSASMHLDRASYALSDLDYHGGDRERVKAVAIKKRVERLIKLLKDRHGAVSMFRYRAEKAEQSFQQALEKAQTDVVTLLADVQTMPETIEVPKQSDGILS